MNNVIWCIVISLMMLVFSIYITLTVPSMPTEDWIAGKVESGQDRYGNCYLYVRGWQWMERVPCDRIGKGG